MQDESDSPSKLKQLKFLGPYERYKLVKPFIQAEEQKAAEKRSAENSTEEPTMEDRIAAVGIAKICNKHVYSLLF